jgi:hypothetical protein
MRGRIGGAGRKAAIAVFGALCALAFAATVAQAAAPVIEGTSVTKVGTTSAVLNATIDPQGALTRYRFEYGLEDCSIAAGCASVPLPEGKITAGSSPVAVEVPIEGLEPTTLYHYRVVAKNPAVSEGSDHVFATSGQIFEGLPDGRAYEQATPLDKDGGDAQGQVALVKAAPDGSAISYGAIIGMPGGKGAEEVPGFLASRGVDSWSSEGLLPPVSVGDRVRVIGWSPDYSRVYSQATRLGSPRLEGLVEQSGSAPPVVIGPYAAEAAYSFAGETADGSVVFFEATVKLPPKEGGTPIAEATEGVANLYAWDVESEEVHLVGIFNEGAPKGSFAGPFGGGRGSTYLRPTHAITPEGDVYFTTSDTGQLYLRRNPTKAQSPLDGQGKCTDPDLACTVHVSASQKTNGAGGGPDPAGEQPAAFQAASKDGSEVFFTSSEMLTNDADTGPEQPAPTIARAKLNGEDLEAKFLPPRAVGVARFGPWLYWAEPKAGVISRAKLNSEEEVEEVQPGFIAIPPSEGECEAEADPLKKPEVFTPVEGAIPSEPRYLAVDSEHVYWTNTGRRNDFEAPIDGGGTIGRAKVNGEEAEEIEPAFICGEEASQPRKRLVSNPQGIAVDAGHIYWANAAQDKGHRTIARAALDGGEVEEAFAVPFGEFVPYGVAVNATHLYFDINDENNNGGYLERVTLDGEEAGVHGISDAGLRGLAIDSGHVYWATQGEGDAIGRADLELENRENEFIDTDGAPNGIAAGASHLFWAVNGEGGENPGNDLYRYRPVGEELTDLTPLAGGNGAEVQGVLGVSDDGTYLYFAANGILAAGATQGDCKGPVKFASGKCNLYAWHEGQVSFVGRLDADHEVKSDALDWVRSPVEPIDTTYTPRTTFLGEGGAVLVFRSQEKLTAYDNEGVPEFYRYRASEPDRLSCITCPPSGEAIGAGPDLGSVIFPNFKPLNDVLAVPSRNLNAEGNRFFFETAEALSPTDTNGAGGCPRTGGVFLPYLACLDVYEWTAPGTGQCSKSAPSYSPLEEGCIYLISTGKSTSPSLFADASEDGKDVFLFTRQRLVGQDEDELQDVYDARVGGGLPGQNLPPSNPCQSAEACHGPVPPPPGEGSPATPSFVGPGDPKPKHKKQKAKKKHKKKHSHHKKQRRAKAGSGGGR